MTEADLNDRYFHWMYQLVYDERYCEGLSYYVLLKHLNGIDFCYGVAMDNNREEDGIDLRYRFGYENSYKRSMISAYLDNRPCSVLEMMAALAFRCEEHIMNDPAVGNRTGQWFWSMIKSLGLMGMDDDHFDEEYVNKAIHRFLNREYERNGTGGLFTIENSTRDMRTAEIYYQMCWYLNSIL